MRMNLRRFLPKTLFMRGLLLVAGPIVLVEAVSAYVFYERHWENVTRHMANSVAGDIAFLAYEEQNLSRSERDEIEWVFGWTTGISSHFISGAALPQAGDHAHASSELARILNHRTGLSVAILPTDDGNSLDVRLQLPGGVLQAVVPAKRLHSSTTTIFLLWTLGSTIFFVGIAIAFLRNQVKPIRRLAEAAERFGKGGGVMDLKPHGAQEVRRAARAFLVMRERILRQIRSRTEMLAGISHDLRTPLTRMKLQLAMLDAPEARELEADVTQMEHMIDEYLDFARGDVGEDAQDITLASALENVMQGYRRAGQAVECVVEQDVALRLRPQAFRRMMTNLIDNALRYGTRCRVTTRRGAGKVEIFIDDEGPGIPAHQRDDVFRPFARLDDSRNLNAGGVGLGLTIARDIARSHGGNITLADAPSHGLRVIVRLPL